MTKLIAWIKTSKWVALAFLAFIGLILGIVVKTMFAGGGDETISGIPPVPSALQKAADDAHEAALKSRIEAAAVADEHKQALATIAQVPDGVARRQQLAEYLKTL